MPDRRPSDLPVGGAVRTDDVLIVTRNQTTVQATMAAIPQPLTQAQVEALITNALAGYATVAKARELVNAVTLSGLGGVTQATVQGLINAITLAGLGGLTQAQVDARITLAISNLNTGGTPSTATSILNLGDTPNVFGAVGAYLVVNADRTGLEWTEAAPDNNQGGGDNPPVQHPQAYAFASATETPAAIPQGADQWDAPVAGWMHRVALVVDADGWLVILTPTGSELTQALDGAIQHNALPEFDQGDVTIDGTDYRRFAIENEAGVQVQMIFDVARLT